MKLGSSEGVNPTPTPKTRFWTRFFHSLLTKRSLLLLVFLHLYEMQLARRSRPERLRCSDFFLRLHEASNRHVDTVSIHAAIVKILILSLNQ